MVATDLTDFRLRRAAMEDVPALRDVFRRSSLSNEGDRASLLAHPDALELSDRAVADGRVRVAVLDDRIDVPLSSSGVPAVDRVEPR